MAKATNSKESEAGTEQAEMQLPTQPTENKISTEDALKQMQELLNSNPDLLKQLMPKQPEFTAAPIVQSSGIHTTPPSHVMPKPVERESRIFILDVEKKGDVLIDMTDDILFTDPVTKAKKTRRMRLIRGAQSIWQDEQNNLPKEHVAKNGIGLMFSRKRCIIPIHETLKIEAALISNRNTDNPNRVGHKDMYFHEWNPEKESQKEEVRQNKIIEAMQIAATVQFTDLKQHAEYLGVAVNDEMGIPLSEQAVRTGYSKKAMNEPEKFLSSIHSPVVKMTHLVRRGVSEGRIDLGKQPNQAFWIDGGFISALPSNTDAIEYLTTFAMTQGEANQRFLSQLQALIT